MQSSLRKTTSSYITSGGGQSTKGRGFAVLHFSNKYIVILSTKNKQWKLDTPVLPTGWFNFAFTWRENGQLKLYVYGTRVASGNPALVYRPQDLFSSPDNGRPNNSDKPLYQFPLMINDLALWERDWNCPKRKLNQVSLIYIRWLTEKKVHEKQLTEKRMYLYMHFNNDDTVKQIK